MHFKRLLFAGLLVLLSILPSVVAAQDDQLAAIRKATDKYQQVEAALADGYAPQFGCVTHREHGAMGIHHINGDLLKDSAVDPLRPEAVMYEPQADGSLKPLGVEYIVFKDAWQAAGNQVPPTLLGQEFKLTSDFFDVPPFYALHIWLWRENPAGLYTGYNPTVACPAELATFPNAAAAAIAPHEMPRTSGDGGPWALIELGLLAGSLTVAGWFVQRAVRRAH